MPEIESPVSLHLSLGNAFDMVITEIETRISKREARYPKIAEFNGCPIDESNETGSGTGNAASV